MDLNNIDEVKSFLYVHKYWIISVIFFVWISLFSENSWYERKRLNNKKEMLVEQKNYYIKKIQRDSSKLNQLKTDNDNLEKFARENYFMSKKNEDVFIIVD